MIELGIMNFMMFFVVIAIGLIFVIAWIVKSEIRINTAKLEIAKLNDELEAQEREKFNLREKIMALQNMQNTLERGPGETDELRRKNEALEEENNRLKNELGEARSSLEEVYKALSSQG